MAKGQLIVISGPSGVGKSTLIRSLTAKLQRQPFFSVSATTRKMRPGEIDHVNYHFITQAEFDRMVAQNEFLEHATYAAHSYGTPAAPILAQLEAGRDVLLDIEVQGALQVKRSYPDAVLIFIAAPSFGELEYRLRARGDTAEDAVRLRLQTARREYEQANFYDYIVANDDIDRGVQKLLAILTAEGCRRKYNDEILKEALSYVISPHV